MYEVFNEFDFPLLFDENGHPVGQQPMKCDLGDDEEYSIARERARLLKASPYWYVFSAHAHQFMDCIEARDFVAETCRIVLVRRLDLRAKFVSHLRGVMSRVWVIEENDDGYRSLNGVWTTRDREAIAKPRRPTRDEIDAVYNVFYWRHRKFCEAYEMFKDVAEYDLTFEDIRTDANAVASAILGFDAPRPGKVRKVPTDTSEWLDERLIEHLFDDDGNPLHIEGGRYYGLG